MDRTRQNGTVRMALLVLLLYFIIPAPFCQVVFEKNFGGSVARPKKRIYKSALLLFILYGIISFDPLGGITKSDQGIRNAELH